MLCRHKQHHILLTSALLLTLSLPPDSKSAIFFSSQNFWDQLTKNWPDITRVFSYSKPKASVTMSLLTNCSCKISALQARPLWRCCKLTRGLLCLGQCHASGGGRGSSFQYIHIATNLSVKLLLYRTSQPPVLHRVSTLSWEHLDTTPSLHKCTLLSPTPTYPSPTW